MYSHLSGLQVLVERGKRMAKRKKNARQWGGFLLSNVVSEGFYGLGGAPVLCRGGGKEVLEEQTGKSPRSHALLVGQQLRISSQWECLHSSGTGSRR